ncbi:putative aquaporin NIP7-1 [Tasmannia lanceolata]|uniref:putative aquaporin NIP7-1 n=1 Tax=Tasmannia lanceolata TaxID=3420 RepID=UPI004062975F
MDVSKGCTSRGDQKMGGNTILRDRNGVAVGRAGKILCFPRWWVSHLIPKVVAEMVGMFIVMFSVCGIIAITRLTEGKIGLLEYASTGGLAIIVVLFAVGCISGAHVNPSVTIAFATIGQFPWSQVPIYVFAQMLGSILACYMGKLVYEMEADFANTRPLHGCKAAFWAELVATFFIMFLASVLSNNVQAVGPSSCFAVGAAIALGVLITGPVSGGSLNPARSLGPAIISWKFDDIWVYLLAPTIGAVSGALLFRLLEILRRTCSATSSSDTSSLPTDAGASIPPDRTNQRPIVSDPQSGCPGPFDQQSDDPDRRSSQVRIIETNQNKTRPNHLSLLGSV